MSVISKNRKIRVMVFGTFDVLHPGHLYFLEQASKLGDFLIVSVARDKNARKHKGYKPIFSENNRLKIVKNLKMVGKAVLGEKENYLKGVKMLKPNVIALGYDQKAYISQLKKDIKEKRIKVKVVRMQAFSPNKYKSAIYKKLIKKS